MQRNAFHSPNVTRPLGKGFCKESSTRAKSDSVERIIWFSDSSGAGKSAIAQTIAERCKQNIAECYEQSVRLAAAFFFFRNSSEQSTSARLVTTLAYEIILFVPDAKEFITKAIVDGPAIFKTDINSQLLHFITRPLALGTLEWNSMQQLLIIIDGLDECTDRIEQSDVFSAISNALSTSDLPLWFFITSCPESNIRTRFERTDLRSATVHIVLDIDGTATQDIAIYLQTEFSRICQEHCIRETPWPPEDVVQSLAERASEQFVDDWHLQPQERLEMVLGILPHKMISLFAEITFLYTQILDAVPVSEVGTIIFPITLFHFPIQCIANP